MPNLHKLIRKIQAALLMKGRIININQFQSYSEKSGRMVTKFVLTEKNKGGKNIPLFESFCLPDVVKFLSGLLHGGESA